MRTPHSQQALTRSTEEIKLILKSHGIRFELIETLPVFTCRQAARAREVPLHNELKTLLVVYEGKIALLNLPGDRRINRRRVRVALATHSFGLANHEEMATLKVTRGTISPLSLTGCRSLLDMEVLTLDWITTNAGNLTLGIKLRVQELLAICKFEVVDISTSLEAG